MSRTKMGSALVTLVVLIGLYTWSSAARRSAIVVVKQPAPPAASGLPAAVPAALQTNTFSLTLQRGRDYQHVSGNIDCPNCKDMYCASLPLNGGSTFVSPRYVGGRPTTNNHWYRCQVQAKCGRPEFSYPQDVRFNCDGKNACQICRATDDGVDIYEDDLEITTR